MSSCEDGSGTAGDGLKDAEGKDIGISDDENDERCPICLSDFDNKAFLDNCFHILVTGLLNCPLLLLNECSSTLTTTCYIPFATSVCCSGLTWCRRALSARSPSALLSITFEAQISTTSTL
jgi:hypothetical protein